MENFLTFFNSKASSDGILTMRNRIECPDGFSISVQASKYHYCSPRETNMGWYNEVECGYPSTDDISDELKKYAETPSNYISSIYGYVPIRIVIRELNRHGFNFAVSPE